MERDPPIRRSRTTYVRVIQRAAEAFPPAPLFPLPLLLLLLLPAAAPLPLPLPLPLPRSARRRLQIASYDSPASRRALVGSGDGHREVVVMV